jgi:hypothetical protein
MDIHQFLNNCKRQGVRLIVQIANVWINTRTHTSGLSIQILQLQHAEVTPPCHFSFNNNALMKTCSTQTEESLIRNTSNTLQTAPAVKQIPRESNAQPAHIDRTIHPVYGTYFKMLCKGVPRPAVQHKMKMNGLDSTVLDLPPDVPLPSPDTEDNTDTQQDALTLSLQDTQSLRKTEVNGGKKNKSASSSGAGHGISLGEILNGLRSLRRTIQGKTITDSKVENTESNQDTKKAQSITKCESSAYNSLFQLLREKAFIST